MFLNLVNDEEAEAQELEERLHQADLERRRLALRNKVQSVSRMLSMYKQLREEREAVSVLHFSPSLPLPHTEFRF